MPHVLLAQQLHIQALSSKESSKTAKNEQPLHWSSTVRHPCYVSYKAPHMHNIVSATVVHGGVVVGTARDVLWDHCQQGVCNAQQWHSCCSPDLLFILQQLQA
jgi:hypothetical protein